MYFPNDIEEKCYSPEHVEEVLSVIANTFPAYFGRYLETRAGAEKPVDEYKKLAEHFGGTYVPKTTAKDSKMILTEVFQSATEEYEKDRDKYRDLLDPETLAEYADDPPSFKTRGLKTECPIIRKTLNNRRAKQLDKYRKSFNLADPNLLLDVVGNISEFARRYLDSFEEDRHVSAQTPGDFGLDELSDERYSVPGVIGGGIRSHFLYKLDPQVFPNRSQDALWALWYLTKKNVFDCRQDSEFLMIRVEENTTAQNYFYPYDLFTYYALRIWHRLHEEYQSIGVPLPRQFRYVAVDSYLTYVARVHDDEIGELKASISDDIHAA